jgi:hypothetical protein
MLSQCPALGLEVDGCFKTPEYLFHTRFIPPASAGMQAQMIETVHSRELLLTFMPVSKYHHKP